MSINKPEEHVDKKNRCGQCQWFASGYDKKNCANLRQVEVDETACIEFTKALPDPYSHFDINDKYIATIKGKIETIEKELDFPKLSVELQSYMVFALKVDFSPGTTQDLGSMDGFLRWLINIRPRVTSIHFQIIQSKRDFNKAQAHAETWLFAKYEMYRSLKPEANKTLMLQRLFPKMIETEESITALLKAVTQLEQLLQSTEFTVRSIFQYSERLWFSQENWSKSNQGSSSELKSNKRTVY